MHFVVLSLPATFKGKNGRGKKHLGWGTHVGSRWDGPNFPENEANTLSRGPGPSWGGVGGPKTGTIPYLA